MNTINFFGKVQKPTTPNQSKAKKVAVVATVATAAAATGATVYLAKTGKLGEIKNFLKGKLEQSDIGKSVVRKFGEAKSAVSNFVGELLKKPKVAEAKSALDGFVANVTKRFSDGVNTVKGLVSNGVEFVKGHLPKINK